MPFKKSTEILVIRYASRFVVHGFNNVPLQHYALNITTRAHKGNNALI
jgi:hypothetical protein